MHPAAKAHFVAEVAEAGRRAAKRDDCPRCGAPCLAGDDHDRVARHIRVDADPVDPVGEMLAILDGLATVDLVRAAGKGGAAFHLHYREPWHVHSDRPARYTIHTEHRCTRKANP
ncbi:MAG TPA: hypothetical protein VFL65_00765 [Jatrophihabitans sp.]|nr:hypothetical protein [Jatrophihabitans sp.]